MPERVTDPSKIVTDALLRKQLKDKGIDKDYVEFWHDYAPRSKGNEYAPHIKFYRNLLSGEHIAVVGQLPKVKADGTKIQVGWKKQGDKYVTKPNLFEGVVEGTKITVTCLVDQYNGRKIGDSVTWQPQLYLNNIEQTCGDAALVGLFDLEYDYGICKRRIRAIQGRLREWWLFDTNPQGEVRIKHNHSGNLKLRLGEYGVDDDVELIPADVFNEARYPIEIGASPETFYPAAGDSGGSTDGGVGRTGTNLAWANVRDNAGVAVNDSNSTFPMMSLRWGSTGWNFLYRGIITFDTSALPDSAVVTGVTFSLYGRPKVDALGISPTMKIYLSTPADYDNLAASDYGQIGDTAYSAAITYADWNTAGYNVFILLDVDTDDYGYIKTGAGAAGVTKLGARGASYDAPNIEPTDSFGGNDITEVKAYAADQGSNKPRLIVTYTAPIDYPINSAVSVGVAVSASRALAIDRDSSVIVGVLVSAVRTLAISRASSVIIGVVASASRAWSRTITSSVIVGVVASASRSWSRTISASVIVGVVASASRSWNVTVTASVAIGIKPIATVWAKLSRILRTFTGRSLGDPNDEFRNLSDDNDEFRELE